MAPEFTAHQGSTHSNVECVGCHVGPGAGGYVRAKVSGLHQLYALAFKTYPTPVPSPVNNLPSTSNTCEHCHWPQRIAGDKLLVKTNYKDDERNTKQTTALVLKIGGRTSAGPVGIHGHHLDDGSRIRYISTDAERQAIPVVYYTDSKGKTIEFVSTDNQATKQQLKKKRASSDGLRRLPQSAHTCL
jgi:hypothetical protein